jgi:DDB1- and CUL4-associated factor 13
MVKVKTICRVIEESTRESTNDIYKTFKNPDSTLHPLQKAREYQRALNAAKLEKIFSKPFIAALSEHTESIFSLARSDKYLSLVVSGSANGEVKLWDLSKMQCKQSYQGHSGAVSGVTFRQDIFMSAGQDSVVNMWNINNKEEKFKSTMPLQGIDLSWRESLFVTCGEDGVELWDLQRSNPINLYQWGSDTIKKAKFNPSENHLICSVSSDRSIILIDTRTSLAISKLKLQLKSNDLGWNPQEPINFTVANEDGNLYTFDMRKLDEANKIHKDHLNSVTCVSYSPTGREFASGSFDKTVRIFDVREGRSREVYHTRRMQWIYAVEYSGDAKFVLTGSDDTNIRIWKAQAHIPLKILLPKEQEAMLYREKLKKAYQYVPEIRRLLKHRHLPRYLFKQKKIKQIQKESSFRKEKNRQAHIKPENLQLIPEKKKVVVE